VPDGDGSDGLVVVWDRELGPQRPGFVVHDPEVDSAQACVHAQPAARGSRGERITENTLIRVAVDLLLT